MYKVNKSMDFQFLVGKELLQLCIGLYQLIFNFTDHVVITTECAIYLAKTDNSTIKLLSDNPQQSKQLVCLLGSTIESVVIESRQELILVFSGGYKLTIIDSNENEESFTITTPEREVIV